MGYAFISYKSEERHIADSIIELLHQNGIDTWIAPDNMTNGALYPSTINRAIKGAKCFVLLLSERAQTSHWILNETERAFNFQKNIFTIHLDNVPMNDDFQMLLCSSQACYPKEINKNDDSINKLLNDIWKYTVVSEEYKKAALQSDNVDITKTPAPKPIEQKQNKKAENPPENTTSPANPDSNLPHSGFVIENGVLIKYNGNSSVVTIPYGVTEIGVEAFLHCNNIKFVTIPDSVTNIDTGAFCGCEKLESIKIPANVTNIGNYAFGGCSKLTSILIANGVTIIDEYAFAGCSNLPAIVIPDSVTSIGDYAFTGCSNLTSIIIPDSLTNIGKWAFDKNAVKRIFTKTSSKTIFKTHLEDIIEIPPKYEIIGEHAFYDESFKNSPRKVKKLTIPSSVKEIYDYAFYDIIVSEIVIPADVTAIGRFAFNLAPDGFITCHKDSYAYKYATEHNLKNSVDIKRIKKTYRLNGVCQHCGGKFTGLLHKKCSVCGKAKDY